MKRLFFTLLIALSALQVMAQPIEVKLKVVDDLGMGLKEVQIDYDGAEAPVFTDASGSAVISVDEGTYINLSLFNEFQKQVLVDSEEMTVVMGSNTRIYGLGYNLYTTKENSSAAIAGIGEDELKITTNKQIMNALYGLIPGLAVYQNGSGAWPEDIEPLVNVRGRGSYNPNSVLILVDGIRRDASAIDVEEVESVTVLKDASALALYGIRGADGAVLITTKRGGNHKFNFKAGYSFGIETPFRIPEMANPVEYAKAFNEALVNDGLNPAYSPADLESIAGGKSPVFATVDWRNHIIRNMGFDNDVHFSLDGSAKKVRYYVYADYTGNRGLFKNTEIIDGIETQNVYDALKLRSNLDFVITPTTFVKVNLAARIQQRTQPLNGTSLATMYAAPALGFPVKYNNIWCRTTKYANPVQTLLGSGNLLTFSRRLSADITILQELNSITKGLTAEVRIAYDNVANINDQKGFSNSYYMLDPYYGEDGTIEDYTLQLYGNDTEMAYSSFLESQFMHMNIWAKLNWARTFGKHNAQAALIFNREGRILAGANNSYVHHDFILNANYDYAGKYLLNVTASYSGSSMMPRGDKFRFYPAVSAAWVVSNEDFLKGSDIVNFLKLRASYGVVGMDSNLSYDMDVQFNGSGNSYFFVTNTNEPYGGLMEGALPSIGINPETDYKSNIGLEFNLFRHLSGSVDLFSNHRKNIRTVASTTVSQVLGIGMSDTFNGEVLNRGFEASLGWDQKIGDFAYSLRGNLAYAKNRILHVDEEYQPFKHLYKEGYSVGQFYGLVFDGYYQEDDFDADGNLLPDVPASTFATVKPGDVKYKDLTGDYKIDNYDNTYQLGTDLPEFYYGVQLGMSWKGLGFNAYFQGTSGYTVATNLDSVYQPLHGNDKNISCHYLKDYWTPSNTNARFPRLTTLENKNNYLASNLWTVEGGYLKLRELELFYDLPKSVTDKLKMSGLRIHLRGHNLFSMDNVGILDPEWVSLDYPTVSSYTIGVNVSF